jgi:hypothetical protein
VHLGGGRQGLAHGLQRRPDPAAAHAGQRRADGHAALHTAVAGPESTTRRDSTPKGRVSVLDQALEHLASPTARDDRPSPIPAPSRHVVRGNSPPGCAPCPAVLPADHRPPRWNAQAQAQDGRNRPARNGSASDTFRPLLASRHGPAPPVCRLPATARPPRRRPAGPVARRALRSTPHRTSVRPAAIERLRRTRIPKTAPRRAPIR